VLRENGYDPKWIVQDKADPEEPTESGPYTVVRVFDLLCDCCAGFTSGFTVVDLSTGVGCGIDWKAAGTSGSAAAAEHANTLNSAHLARVRYVTECLARDNRREG
jgi:hypothetical protein